MFLYRVIYGVVAAGSCIHVVGEYVAEFTLLVGPSMTPTLNSKSSGDIVLTEHITPRLRTLCRGDIVILRSPQDPSSLVCKRITAMAGDLVNTGPNKDDYKKIPKGHLWLLGDNCDDSTDSRDYGSVPYGLVRGRVCFKVWPFSEFGKITNHILKSN